MKEHWDQHKEGLLEKIIRDEVQDGRRIIFENETMICFLPSFARYTYETWIVPKRRVGHLYSLNDKEYKDLSEVLKTIINKYDKLWDKTFPYLMTINQAPVKGDHPYGHFFFQFIPPYRTKDRLKYLAGTELGAGIFINDSLPEEKAAELKNVIV